MTTQDAVAAAPELPSPPVTERAARSVPGLLMLVAGIAAIPAGVVVVVVASHQGHGAAEALTWLGVLIFAVSALVLGGLTPVVPGQARVIQLFGRYRGTIRDPGLQDPQPGIGAGQGQRRGRQPDRDRGRGRLAGPRHRQRRLLR